MAKNRPKVIIWTKDGLVYWHICVTRQVNCLHNALLLKFARRSCQHCHGHVSTHLFLTDLITVSAYHSPPSGRPLRCLTNNQVGVIERKHSKSMRICIKSSKKISSVWYKWMYIESSDLPACRSTIDIQFWPHAYPVKIITVYWISMCMPHARIDNRRQL